MKVTNQDICPDVTEFIHEVGKTFKGTQYNDEIFKNIVSRMRLPQPLHNQRSVI